MSTIEEEVISYIAVTGDLATVTDAGITHEHFLDPDNRQIFKEILDFRADFGESPTADVILRDHPTYRFVTDSSGPLDYLLRELHAERLRVLVELGLGAAGDALEESGPEAALNTLRLLQSQAALATPTGLEVDYARTGPERLALYRAARENPDEMLGIPTGFRFLDKVTRGLQRQQMIVLTGLAKSCKTTVLLGMVRTAFEFGVKPLVLSFEMPYLEIVRRLDGFVVGVNPMDLLTGKVSERDWRRLEKVLMTDHEDRSLIFTEDRAGTTTLTGIQAKLDSIQPDVVFVDGAYFLHDTVSGESQTPIALTNISRGLKRLALNNDLPVVVTTQSLAHKLGRNGLSAHSLGYTSAWIQDADLVIGTEATEEEYEYRLKVLIARNAMPQETLLSIQWDPPKFEEAPEEALDALPY